MPTSAGTRRNPAAAKCESNANAWRMRSALMNAKLVASTKLKSWSRVSVEDREGAPLQILTDEDTLQAPRRVE